MPNDDPPVSVACSLALSCSLLLFTHTLGCSRRFVSVVFEPRSLSVACGKEKATTTIITTETTTTRTAVLNYARFYIKWSFIFFFFCFFLHFHFAASPAHTHTQLIFVSASRQLLRCFLSFHDCVCLIFVFCPVFAVRCPQCRLSFVVDCLLLSKC